MNRRSLRVTNEFPMVASSSNAPWMVEKFRMEDLCIQDKEKDVEPYDLDHWSITEQFKHKLKEQYSTGESKVVPLTLLQKNLKEAHPCVKKQLKENLKIKLILSSQT